jgi:hypothetical protein
MKAARKFLVTKSNDLLSRQIDTYRAIQTKAGVFLGIISVFLPLFLFLADKSKDFIILLSVIPVLTVGWGLVEIINILKAHDLFVGVNEDEFDELINEKLRDVELFEIGANKISIKSNDKIISKLRRKYQRAVWAMLVSISLSILILTFEIFLNKDHKDQKDKTIIKNTVIMGDKDKSGTKKDTIPKVPVSKLKTLNEGKKVKSDTATKKK